MNETAIYQILLELKENVGAIKATTEATKETLTSHIEKTESLAEAVRKVELAHAKQRGAAKAYSLVGGAVGAILGGAATFLAEIWRHP